MPEQPLLIRIPEQPLRVRAERQPGNVPLIPGQGLADPVLLAHTLDGLRRLPCLS